MIQRKLFKKCLTLALAVATAVTSVSVPGGLLAPEKVYAEDTTQAPQEGLELRARVNEEYTAYIIDVLKLVDTDTVKYEYRIGDEGDYQPLAELKKKEFGAEVKVELYVRKSATDVVSQATKCAITTPAASEAPVISGEEKFKDSTTVTITATNSAIHYTTDGTTPTAQSPKYTAPIEVTSTAAIKAIAIQDGHIMSAVVEKTFTKESSGGSSSGGSSSGGSSSGGSSSGGSTESGSETTPPQGDNKSNVTTRTETREDGTIVTTTETWAEDGSVQIRTEIRNEKTGMSIVVNVSKNAKGKITSAAAEIFDRGFGNVKISGAALSEIVNAAGTKNVKTTIKMLTKNGWVIREVTVNVNTLLKRTVRPKKMKVVELDPETGEKIVVSKTPFRVAADGSVELDHNLLGYGIYELVTADEEEALTKKLLRSVRSAKQSTSISEGKRTLFRIDSDISWYNVDKVTYLTGNPNVAKVDSDGRITGLKPGKAIIKAVVRLKNGKSTVLRMVVTVNEKN